MNERKPIGKRIRFEVFKRDSFKCQYCGACAPDVLLEIDHIVPLAEGGDSEITNLLTACKTCNLGKGARPLSENAAVSKSRSQLEDLQERREQLEMMLAWRDSLREIQADEVTEAAERWRDHCIGFHLNEQGLAELKKLIRGSGLSVVLEVMDKVCDLHLQFGADGNATAESAETAWRTVGNILAAKRNAAGDPTKERMFYIRGILRRRCKWINENRVLEWMEIAASWGVTVEEMEWCAKRSTSQSKFWDRLIELIDRNKAQEGE